MPKLGCESCLDADKERIFGLRVKFWDTRDKYMVPLWYVTS